jgi:hypothetical protein
VSGDNVYKYADESVIFKYKYWFNLNWGYNLNIFFANIIFFLIVLFHVLRRRTCKAVNFITENKILYLIIFIGFAFWLVTVPDFRFGFGITLFVLSSLMSYIILMIKRNVIYKLVTLSLPFILSASLLYSFVFYHLGLKRTLADNLIRPEKYRTVENEKIIKPNCIFYNAIEKLPSDSPLPSFCQLYPFYDTKKYIMLRGNNIQDGFRQEDNYKNIIQWKVQ